MKLLTELQIVELVSPCAASCAVMEQNLKVLGEHNFSDIESIRDSVKKGFIEQTEILSNGRAQYMVFWHINDIGTFDLNLAVSLTKETDNFGVLVKGVEMLASRVKAKAICFHTRRRSLIEKSREFGYRVESAQVLKVLGLDDVQEQEQQQQQIGPQTSKTQQSSSQSQVGVSGGGAGSVAVGVGSGNSGTVVSAGSSYANFSNSTVNVTSNDAANNAAAFSTIDHLISAMTQVPLAQSNTATSQPASAVPVIISTGTGDTAGSGGSGFAPSNNLVNWVIVAGGILTVIVFLKTRGTSA